MKKISFSPVTFRLTVQWLFFGWILYTGYRFSLFVRHFETFGGAPFVPRPAGVDGFLPIGGLAGLKYWLLSGSLHPYHPAATILLVVIVVMSLVARKSFCSWLCPVGTLSEAVGKVGAALNRSFRLWRPLDVALRGVKYLLLFFFLRIILFGMPGAALSSFLDAPYWAMSDVKMLHFFTGMSGVGAGVIAALVLLSMLVKGFWCRYLCPYGALLGVVALLSPFRICRDSATCTSCGRCSKACPSLLPVERLESVRSAECSGCLSCVDTCPHGSLSMTVPLRRRMPVWVFPAVALGCFAFGVCLGMITGNWESSLRYEDYRQLFPLVGGLSH